jgi:hypothetical protein
MQVETLLTWHENLVICLCSRVIFYNTWEIISEYRGKLFYLLMKSLLCSYTMKEKEKYKCKFKNTLFDIVVSIFLKY